MSTTIAIISALFIGIWLGSNFYRLVWSKELISGRLRVDFKHGDQPVITGIELEGNCKDLFSKSGIVLKIVSYEDVNDETRK